MGEMGCRGGELIRFEGCNVGESESGMRVLRSSSIHQPLLM